MVLKDTGMQVTFCNLGTTALTSFPVRVALNGVSQNFDIVNAYQPAKCVAMNWPYSTWGINLVSGAQYSATVTVDPYNAIQETNEFDNVATIAGTL